MFLVFMNLFIRRSDIKIKNHELEHLTAKMDEAASDSLKLHMRIEHMTQKMQSYEEKQQEREQSSKRERQELQNELEKKSTQLEVFLEEERRVEYEMQNVKDLNTIAILSDPKRRMKYCLEAARKYKIGKRNEERLMVELMGEKERNQELQQQLLTLNSSTRVKSQHVSQLECEKQALNAELTKTICERDSIKNRLADFTHKRRQLEDMISTLRCQIRIVNT